MTRLSKCPGCGALVRDMPGEAHRYIGASAGCWEVYGEVLAREYGEYGYPEPTHRLTVDTYAVQHPGNPGRQANQSVNVHLMGLCCVLDLGMDGRQATRAISLVIRRRPAFAWLGPPVPNGRITVLDVVKAQDLAEHQRLVEAWARDVWQAWSPHHRLVRDMLRTRLG